MIRVVKALTNRTTAYNILASDMGSCSPKLRKINKSMDRPEVSVLIAYYCLGLDVNLETV